MADFFDIPTLTFLVSTVTQQNVALDERLKSKSQEHNDFIEKAKVAEASVLKIQEDLELERQVWKDESLKLKEDLRLKSTRQGMHFRMKSQFDDEEEAIIDIHDVDEPISTEETPFQDGHIDGHDPVAVRT
ncbi:hypothetical protein AUEXF2481DRAFT_5949 [Aureobasidium subglaciale EXF-2481]|uniref:Uncharacterized protein n=1 Tax=Aureobasidium subglaciale (strain EXF-2481) TaxID=1043005 RepID=A0A074Y9L6_AURSE|nr:uncharacterized protein AUEXF2481DRAFT_5949 [Aureobasidium subglaciale EXF-2481]KEQ94465.1 hypothetical protein AUEXF2481DRAFT_5949 [Aureobasidium subglaciale EXF-2481]